MDSNWIGTILSISPCSKTSCLLAYKSWIQISVLHAYSHITLIPSGNDILAHIPEQVDEKGDKDFVLPDWCEFEHFSSTYYRRNSGQFFQFIFFQFSLILNEWSFCFAFRTYALVPIAALYCEGPLCRAGIHNQILMVFFIVFREFFKALSNFQSIRVCWHAI